MTFQTSEQPCPRMTYLSNAISFVQSIQNQDPRIIR